MASAFTQKASNKEGEEFELPRSGLHPAVLVALIDLGTHTFEYQGKTSENRKLFLVWELTGEHDSNGQTFVIGADYTWSLHKKANFRRMLEAWSGRTFADDEEFDPLILIDKPCVVNVARSQTSKAKEFAEVSGVASPMPGQAIPPRSREPFAWHISQADVAADPPIPDWIPRIYGRLVKDDIKSSKEWAEAVRMADVHKAIPSTADKPNGAPVTNPSHVAPVQMSVKPPF